MKSLRSMSVRVRLAVWFAAILAVVLTIYIGVVFAFQYVLLERQIFHDEVQDVETVEGLMYFDAAGSLHIQENYHSQPQSRLLVDRLMEVRDMSGMLLYRSDTLKDSPLGGSTLPNEGASSFNERHIRLSNRTPVLVISHIHPVQGKLVLIRLGYSLAPLYDRMEHFFFLLLLATPVGLLLAGFAGYSISRRALLPLDQMAARSEQITAHNLSDRLFIENPDDELGRMARAVNHLLDRLEQAFLQLQRFTSDAAHELKTPLTALRAMGEGVLETSHDEEIYRETIGGMLEETAHLHQTIEGLLLLAKTETTKAIRNSDSFSMPELVDEILVLLDVLLDERHIRVEQDGRDRSEFPLRADRSLIRIALMNVIHNAIKFSPNDALITISYCTDRSSDRPLQRLCVQDSGPGIPPDELERVFDRFFTGTSPKTLPQRGAGLGLSIAKLIVERSDGEIAFELKPSGQGTKCCIGLPTGN